MRQASRFQKSDERMLGSGDFVEHVLAQAEEHMKSRYRLKAQGIDYERAEQRVCEVMSIEKRELYAGGKNTKRVQARSILCYWGSRELGISQTELARQLKLSPAAVALSVKRGEELVRQCGYSLLSWEEQRM